MKAQKMKIFETLKKSLASTYFIQGKGRFYTDQKQRAGEAFLAFILEVLYLLIDAVTVKEYMDSIYMTGAAICTLVSYMCTIFKSELIFICLDEIENLVNERSNNPKSKAMYEKSNRLAEKISKLIQFVVVHVSVPVYVLPKAIYSYFMYFTTELGADAFDLPIPTWFPFDWKNPIGYMIAVLLQLRMVYITLSFFAPFVALGIVVILFLFSIADDMKNDIKLINESAQFKRTHKFIFEQLSKLIPFTARRRIIDDISDLYQILLIFVFLGCTFDICLALLMFQISLTQGLDSVIVMESIFYGFWSLNLVLVACESNQRLSDTFNEVNDTLENVDWYRLPIEIQRMLPLVIMFVQKPVVVKFFGSSSCSRVQFKKVINAGYKYFMVLRRFYN